MKSAFVIQISAISGFLAVAFGAFGAHALKQRLSSEMLAIYHTAVEYQFIHTLALLVVGLLIQIWGKSTPLTVSAIAFSFGIVVFSGSLYLLSLTGIRWLGAITPIGGIAFLIGWASLLVAAFEINS